MRDARASRRLLSGRLRSDKGSALIVTLFIVATLVILAVSLAEDTGVEVAMVSYSRDERTANLAAYAGVQAAMGTLDSDEDLETDTLQENWANVSAKSFALDLPQNTELSLKISDESAKININELIRSDGSIDSKRQGQIARLFTALDIPEENLAALLDWLDKDDIERLNGAEYAYYKNLSPPYPCANGPLITLGQMKLIKGFENLDLTPYFTLYSDGKINLNTASVEVLQSISEKWDRNLAEAVVTSRQRDGFGAVEDVRNIPGFSKELFQEVRPFITVASSAFQVVSEGRYAGTSELITTVVRRNENGVVPVYWRVH